MTRHRNATLRDVIRRLRLSPSSIAAAAAAYDVLAALALAPSRSRYSSGLEKRTCSHAIASPGAAS
jgi:hypothetical protein